MGKLIYGAHMSISKGFLNACKVTYEDYKANGMQIFLKNPRGRREKELKEEEAKKVKDYSKEKDIFIVGHCSYLLNFAKDLSKSKWVINSLISDLKKIYKLGGIGVVLHIGKYLKLEKDKAYEYLKKNIEEALKKTEEENNYIILENTAGQGTEIGWNLEELEYIYKKILNKHPRIKFCFDTAHAFAAGYDLSNSKKVLEVFKKFDKLLGLENLVLIHFNDSKKKLGSRVDRHENIGKGFIGKEGLISIIKFGIENSIPLIIETPETEEENHFTNLERIRKWIKKENLYEI